MKRGKEQPHTDRRAQFRGAPNRIHHTRRFNPVWEVSLSVLIRNSRFSDHAADGTRPTARPLDPRTGLSRLGFALQPDIRRPANRIARDLRLSFPPDTFALIHYATNTPIGRHPLYSTESRINKRATSAPVTGGHRPIKSRFRAFRTRGGRAEYGTAGGCGGGRRRAAVGGRRQQAANG